MVLPKFAHHLCRLFIKIKKPKENKMTKKLNVSDEAAEEQQKRLTEKEIQQIREEAKHYFIDNEIIGLLEEEPFFGEFSISINKIRSKKIPTACVGWNKERMSFDMHYNPLFFVQLTDEEKLAVIIHEFYHVIYKHVTSRLPFDPEENPELMKKWNYATDFAINSQEELKDRLPDGLLLPENFDLPDERSSEWYMQNMPEDAIQEPECQMCEGEGKISFPNDGGGDSQGGESGEDEQQAGGQEEGDEEQSGGEGEHGDHSHSHDSEIPCPNCNGGWQFDEHSWGEGREEGSAAENEMKRIAKKAMDNAKKQNKWGNVPGRLQKRLESLFETQIDWRRELRSFVQKTRPSNKRSSIRKISRRFPWIHPGRKRDKEAKLAICIDQSGSVSDEMLAHFFAELGSLSQTVSFTVIPFDSEVNEEGIFEWEKGQNIEAERVSCGGTDFNPPTRYVNEDGTFDGMIIMSDMYAPKPIPCTSQRAWVRPDHCEPNFNTNEKVIPIDIEALD